MSDALPREFALIAKYFPSPRRSRLAGPERRCRTADPAAWSRPRADCGRHGRRRALPAGRSARPGWPQAVACQSVRPRRQGSHAAWLPADRLHPPRHAGNLVRRLHRRSGAGSGGVRDHASGRRHHLNPRADFIVADRDRPCRARDGRASLRRHAGDGVWVTGTIGDGALGLAVATGRLVDPSGFLLGRYRLPQPRLGLAIGGVASAGMDVSDGLVQDLGQSAAPVPWARSSRQPGCRCPPAVQAAGAAWLETCLTGGDDYELLLAVPPAREAALLAPPTRAAWLSPASAPSIPVRRTSWCARRQENLLL